MTLSERNLGAYWSASWEGLADTLNDMRYGTIWIECCECNKKIDSEKRFEGFYHNFCSEECLCNFCENNDIDKDGNCLR